MKIAIVVHGRFHAFDLARALIARGHEVTVFTNYPGWAAKRFGLAPRHVRSYARHGAASRIIERLGMPRLGRWWEPVAHRAFGRWAARTLAREHWDVIHCWSGVSEEILMSPVAKTAATLLMRGSAHIATQRRLLDEEGARAGVEIDHPSAWMVEREQREYARADRIVVLSSFAARTFREHGIESDRVAVLELGVRTESFQLSAAQMAARIDRVRRGEPLSIVFVGTLSFQKGLFDLAAVARALDRNRFRITLIGQPLPETRALIASLDGRVTVVGKVPQTELREAYARADMFLFPTIQDGFAVVLAQAKAAGLPILTTSNSGGADLVAEGEDGWVVPIRRPEVLIDRLRWYDAHRSELTAMMERIGSTKRTRDYAEVASDFEVLCRDELELRGHAPDGAGLTQRPRIMYVQYTNPGGYPPVQHSAQILADAGAEVLVLGTVRPDDRMTFASHEGITVRLMPFARAGWRQKAHYVRFLVWVAWEGRTWKPDWVYASDPLSAPAALTLVRTSPGVRAVYHEHDSPAGDGSHSLFMRTVLAARRRLARQAECCVLPNEGRAEVFSRDHRQADVVIVWNCPRRNEALVPLPPRRPDRMRVLYHGSIVPARLPMAVVDALAFLPEGVTLVVAGYETAGHIGYVDALLRRAADRGYESRVEFVGALPRERLMALCGTCDVGLAFMPAATGDINERWMVGASNKPFDYLACGLPVLVNDLPDWRTAFVDSGYGAVCQAEVAGSISAALRWLLDHPTERRAMGEAGRRRILEDWNYERQFSSMARQMLGGGASDAPYPVPSEVHA